TARLVKANYTATGKKSGSVALVGKGVVFDSGGLSLKTSSGMETMKTDMSGAAAVLATMSVLKALDVKAKVTAYVPMVENMPSGTAIRPGDVLRIRNGKTVEVLNTDAEGRLILADGLALAAEDKPDAVVDVATLTGACMVALGDKIAGLMGNRDSWNAQVQAAADTAGEPMWPLPLPKDYRKLLESEVADLRNISTGSYGGALTAALFLSEFVDGVPWVHLDIAGPARAGSDDGYVVKGGTGFAVRTLVELVDRFKKPAGSNAAGSANGAATRRPAAPATARAQPLPGGERHHRPVVDGRRRAGVPVPRDLGSGAREQPLQRARRAVGPRLHRRARLLPAVGAGGGPGARGAPGAPGRDPSGDRAGRAHGRPAGRRPRRRDPRRRARLSARRLAVQGPVPARLGAGDHAPRLSHRAHDARRARRLRPLRSVRPAGRQRGDPASRRVHRLRGRRRRERRPVRPA